MKTIQMGPLNTFKQRATHIALGLGLAATLAFGAVMPALAADGELNLQAGTSSVSIADFVFEDNDSGTAPGTPITLTGAAGLTATAAPAVTMINAEGASADFTMTMQAGDFENADASKTLVANPRVTSAGVGGGTALFTDFQAGVLVNGTNVVAGATVEPGTHAVTPIVVIDIPADTELDTYTSTFTVSFVAAP